MTESQNRKQVRNKKNLAQTYRRWGGDAALMRLASVGFCEPWGSDGCLGGWNVSDETDIFLPAGPSSGVVTSEAEASPPGLTFPSVCGDSSSGLLSAFVSVLSAGSVGDGPFTAGAASDSFSFSLPLAFSTAAARSVGGTGGKYSVRPCLPGTGVVGETSESESRSRSVSLPDMVGDVGGGNGGVFAG